MAKDSEENPDVWGAEVIARNTFRKSALYGSFVEHRINQLVEKAWGGERADEAERP